MVERQLARDKHDRQGQETENSHSQQQREWTWQSYELSKTPAHDRPPSTRPYLLNLPKQHRPQGTKCLNIQAHWEHLSFKPPLVAALNELPYMDPGPQKLTCFVILCIK